MAKDIAFKKQIDDCRQQILILKSADRVPLRIAKFFIEHTAYWDHPSGSLVKAPKHADNITDGENGWELRLGGNSFLVECAIDSSIKLLYKILDSFLQNNIICTYSELKDRLILIVRGSVANNNGYKYSGYYPCYGDNIFFGTQVINIKSFVNIILSTIKIEKVYNLLKSKKNVIIAEKPADGRYWKSSQVYKRPNAKCPICTKPVYFIEMDNGGRVFFDDLGPPWPKHPCTDSRIAQIFVPFYYAETTLPDQLNQDWFLLSETKVDNIVDTESLNNRVYIYGYCHALKRRLKIMARMDKMLSISSPILVKPDTDHTGAFDVSYIYSISTDHSVFTETRRFYPAIGGGIDMWEKAFDGDSEAENEVGWYHSFFWKDINLREYNIAKHWFSRAISHGNLNAMNNLGVMFLKGLGVNSDSELAFQYLMKAALQMTPTAFGHIGDMFQNSNDVCFDMNNSKIMSQLFYALERKLSFDSDNDDKKIFTLADFLYSPQPIDKYFHVETIKKISETNDCIPLWNLFWLATDGLDESLNDPFDWYKVVSIPRGLVDTLLLDMDDCLDLESDVTLRDALRLHPRKFLEYFNNATDFSISNLQISKRTPNWTLTLIKNIEATLLRIEEIDTAKPASVVHIDFRSKQ